MKRQPEHGLVTKVATTVVYIFQLGRLCGSITVVAVGNMSILSP
jgi:hypothetical protein